MLRPRIIPCLLIKDDGLVKTVNFSNPKYVGDPINTVRIFNEKHVDELIVFDIDATVKGKEPNMKMIHDLATECRMPLCYGGGIQTVEQIGNIIELGVEKISLSSSAISNPDIVNRAAKIFGNQSIVVTLDIKNVNYNYQVYTYNGRNNTKLNPIDLVKKLQDNGAGEIIINSINDDGSMKGYNYDLIKVIKNNINIPLSAIGGAGSLNDFADLFHQFGIIGASAGSLFVFKGRYKAVLINYPSREEKNRLYLQK